MLPTLGKNQESRARKPGGSGRGASGKWRWHADWFWGWPWPLSEPARHISEIKTHYSRTTGRSNRVRRKDDGAESGHVSGTGRGRRAHPYRPQHRRQRLHIPGGFCLYITRGRKARTCRTARAAFSSSVRTPKTNLNNYCTPPRTRREPPEGGQPLHETQMDRARKAPKSACRLHD